MNKQEIWMQRALDLSLLGSGLVAPNPLVGCVIVKNNQILGEGWHQAYGQAHAEVMAIRSLANPEDSIGSSVYVSLEPCSHTGKTPPCADLLIKSQVKEVFICNLDPNPLVAGQGIEKLKAAGIQVFQGILENKGAEINRQFFTYHTKKRPYITLKWAASQDGYIAQEDGNPVRFSNPQSQALVHQMRTQHQGILVGAETIIQDNPRLNARLWPGNSPIRIVFDPHDRIPKNSQVVQDGQCTWIITKNTKAENGPCQWYAIGENYLLEDIIQLAYEKGLISILVEGGAKTLTAFLQSGLFDEVWKQEKDMILGKGIAEPRNSINWKKGIQIGEDNSWYQADLG
ncbi:bifunctional diaminohydroxyphosphoribosylaminopyrimidine deaminase/5-amino-6-(5-phosphoribosylamino)uracil reductase RibD [Aquirufa ecclesiirivi]|uniref:bifunctional diaminohydroxyphosphoribosylaminopyrimidine deaminase/5-amino-6-(5-phosphoribosylamino)uracil reductase RibD n=1 Tax=Aquirufa ecclesiirivi TaxID=2715124 RepID=UPI0023D84AAD|nr:bifunctional diaminohydroxyphosphoribosylaminopyrimidine deaminase/5-amino-6-(5-phosphoribosylamino)uracil reductase RibD [Aquirufa ecclesiirivi]MDF0692366.1 bifunctional diaminohydroxyphosphoribosylaminopyrimidine deaminase/5-amino-6-(5-phosphoribosylamino)uracil reductase RibD [Aquirufa ecclesiirivi]